MMGEDWQYQVRIYLNDALAETARRDPDDPALAPLAGVLRRHRATIKSQYDAFADYVAEAAAGGAEGDPLYAWTKATIEDPAKKAKYVKVFAVYVDGDEVYAKDTADALEADLEPLVDGETVLRLTRHDTNPANTPQPPARFRT
jgi:hypothetical protein